MFNWPYYGTVQMYYKKTANKFTIFIDAFLYLVSTRTSGDSEEITSPDNRISLQILKNSIS